MRHPHHDKPLTAAERAQAVRDIRAYKRRPKHFKVKRRPIKAPVSIEAKYSAMLRLMVRNMASIIVSEIRPLLEMFPTEAAKQDHLRTDEAPPKPGIPLLFESTIQRLRRTLKPKLDAQTLKQQVFDPLDTLNLTAMNQAAEVFTSIPLFRGTTAAQQTLLDAAVDDNVSLISSIPEEMLDRVKDTLYDGWSKGQRYTEVAAQLQEDFGITERRANFIARDQILKANSQLTESRSGDLGIKRYEWSTSGDSRVRPRHRELNGTIQNFADPPIASDEGQPIAYANPGGYFGCRCNALPLLEEALDALESADE